MKQIHSRRSFLKMMGFFTISGVGAVMVGCGGDSDHEREGASTGYKKGTWSFPNGIASGDPREDSVVLWTRLESKNNQHMQGDVEVLIQVSSVAFDDPEYSQARLLVAHPIKLQAKYAHTLHHKVEGLVPGRHYWYRFVVGEDVSVQGRTKTAPKETAHTALKFAYLSCQDWGANHWGAYQVLGRPEYDDLDFIVHLGDYIYETANDATFQSGAVEEAHQLNAIDANRLTGISPDGTRYANSLEEYRYLYSVYRSDPRIQEVHAKFPMIAVWDDHEFTDDAWMANETYSDENTLQLERRRAANQAWFEYMPVTMQDVNFEPDNQTDYDNIRIYREFAFGQVMQLIMTDERLYRADHTVPEEQGTAAMVKYFDRIIKELGDTENPNGLYQFIKKARIAFFSLENILNSIINKGKIPVIGGIDGVDLTTVKPALVQLLNMISEQEFSVDQEIKVIDIFKVLGQLDAQALVSQINRTTGMTGLGARYAALQEVLLACEKMSATAPTAILGAAQSEWWKSSMSAAQERGAVWKIWGNEVSLLNMHVKVNRIRNQGLQLPESLDMLASIVIGLIGVLKYLLTNEPARQQLKFPEDYTSDGSAATAKGQELISFADCWDGYPDARHQLFQHLQQKNIQNVVAITGDLHTFFAGSVHDAQGQAVMLDFAGAGVSSNSFGGILSGMLKPEQLSEGMLSGIAPLLLGRGQPNGMLYEILSQITSRTDKENDARDLFARLLMHFSDDIQWAEGVANGFSTVNIDAEKIQVSFHNLRVERDASGQIQDPNHYLTDQLDSVYERRSQFTVYAAGTEQSKVEETAAVWPAFPQRVQQYENPAVRPQAPESANMRTQRMRRSAVVPSAQRQEMQQGLQQFVDQNPSNPYAQLFLETMKNN